MPVLTFQTFDDAWNEFTQTNHFGLKNAALSLKELYKLHAYIKNCSDPLSIYLSEIQLVSQYATYSVTEKHYSESRSKISSKNEIASLEQALLNLLSHDRWQIIQLNKIAVMESLSLSENFYHRLLCFSYFNDLKKLNLYLPNANLEPYFLRFLKTNPELEILRLDLAYEAKNFIQELSSSITDSKITQLNLGNTSLDLAAYNALDSLLDNDYDFQLTVPQVEHEDEELNDVYTQLVQRAAKKGHERFKEEQLTQHKLLTIAEDVLRQKHGLTDFLRLSNALPMTTDMIKFRDISDYVPQIYKKHLIYINRNYQAFRLDLLMPFELDPQKTAAHHLINVAITMEDGESILAILEEVKAQDEAGFATLLKAGEENSALAIFSKFDNKNNKPPSWLKPVKSYIEKHIKYLLPRFETLSCHKELYTLLREFRDHLTHYLDTMNERSEWPAFFTCITGVTSQLRERKGEWDSAFKALKKAVAAGTNPDQQLASERIRALRQYLLPIAYRSENSKKGWKNTSELHDGNYYFVREVDRVADDLRRQLTIQEDPEKVALQAEIKVLKATIKEKDKIIAEKNAYIESLENEASPGGSKDILQSKSSIAYRSDSDLEHRPLAKKPSYLGIFASIKPPSESDSESEGSGYSALSLSIPSGWGD